MAEQQSYTITGRVAVKGMFKQITEKVRIRDLIIDTDCGQYSQLVRVEFFNDQGNKLNMGDCLSGMNPSRGIFI